MQSSLKFALVAGAAACLLGATMVAPSMAQLGHEAYRGVPYSNYQGPDGTYDSAADFSRDIWGVPCGVNCTQRAQARWSHYYDHSHPHLYGQ
ncbi:MAG: hypothetical protein ACLQIQ_02665 [Beijerinckiaceae bacterium]